MPGRGPSLLAQILCAMVMIATTDALLFELPFNQKACFFVEVPSRVVTVRCDWARKSPDAGHKFVLNVMNTRDAVVRSEAIGLAGEMDGSVEFRTQGDRGEYTLCFQSQGGASRDAVVLAYTSTLAGEKDYRRVQRQATEMLSDVERARDAAANALRDDDVAWLLEATNEFDDMIAKLSHGAEDVRARQEALAEHFASMDTTVHWLNAVLLAVTLLVSWGQGALLQRMLFEKKIV